MIFPLAQVPAFAVNRYCVPVLLVGYTHTPALKPVVKLLRPADGSET